MNIQMPSSIKSNKQGYQDLLAIYVQIKDCNFETIQLDCFKTQWFDANLFALLGAFLSDVKVLNSVSFINLSNSLKKVMIRNGFLQRNKSVEEEKYKTAIPYQKFKSNEEQGFCNYIEKELLQRDEFPVMSDLLKKKMSQKMIEIFTNAHQHSQSDFVYTCGQYYREKSKLSFTIADMGTTIQENVKSFQKKSISAIDAIIWAVDEGTTTRPRSAGLPGGLGLNLLREFAKMNKGRIQIVSDCALWEQSEIGKIATFKLDNAILGTIVNIEFNLSDTASYKLRHEPEIKF